jgi:biopolymer transport protein ExbB
MTAEKLIELANASGGTLYVMALLLLIALTVVIERTRYLFKMQHGGQQLIDRLHDIRSIDGTVLKSVLDGYYHLPHGSLFQAAMIEPQDSSRELCAGHLEEALMREVPLLDRSLWMLDTVITLAPLLGLFGTIIGMFGAFSVLGDVQNSATQVTGGIAEALIATASGLFIAMIGLVFFNSLNVKVRLIVHQIEVIKLMLLNRRFGTPPAEEVLQAKLRAV